jgi:hypothetical protein
MLPALSLVLELLLRFPLRGKALLLLPVVKLLKQRLMLLLVALRGLIVWVNLPVLQTVCTVLTGLMMQLDGHNVPLQ